MNHKNKINKMLSKESLKLYRALNELNTPSLTHVLKHIDANGIESICECIYNTIYTDLSIPKSKSLKIRRNLANAQSKRNIKIITKKLNSTERKRRALIQEGKGIGLILSTVVPLLANLLFKKK